MHGKVLLLYGSGKQPSYSMIFTHTVALYMDAHMDVALTGFSLDI